MRSLIIHSGLAAAAMTTVNWNMIPVIIAALVIIVALVLAIMGQVRSKAGVITAGVAVLVAALVMLFFIAPDWFFTCAGLLVFALLLFGGYALSTKLPVNLKPVAVFGGTIVGGALMFLVFAMSPLYSLGQTPVSTLWQDSTTPMPELQQERAVMVPTLTISTPAATQTPACTNQGSFVQDVTVPDKTILAFGQSFAKTWRIKNTGTCVWGTGYSLVPLGGSLMSGVAISVGKTVFPGETIDLTVNLVAPVEPQLYRGEWGMQDAAGKVFPISKADGKVWVEIIVLPPTPRP